MVDSPAAAAPRIAEMPPTAAPVPRRKPTNPAAVEKARLAAAEAALARWIGSEEHDAVLERRVQNWSRENGAERAAALFLLARRSSAVVR